MDELTLIVIAIIVLFCIFCLTIGSLFYLLGLTKTIDVGAGAPPIKNVVVAYKFNKGPYKGCGDLFTEVAKLAPYAKPIGIYYDDPKTVIYYDYLFPTFTKFFK